jgi:hypothetical protein
MFGKFFFPSMEVSESRDYLLMSFCMQHVGINILIGDLNCHACNACDMAMKLLT